ncbi:hypothetical protein [Sphingomonas sp. LK11]|uniref:hypothetical protein n=1 Tax=Sphingomonas sp. LK11 TaxID=1390395 RepID=UPI00155FFA7C|nr:hypothetical protein [Sphingomonas sp. LK11]
MGIEILRRRDVVGQQFVPDEIRHDRPALLPDRSNACPVTRLARQEPEDDPEAIAPQSPEDPFRAITAIE